MHVFTVGHGIRPLDELIETLRESDVQTLVDVRRFPGSRRNPQFNQGPLRGALDDAGIVYRHAVQLGGRRTGEPARPSRHSGRGRPGKGGTKGTARGRREGA